MDLTNPDDMAKLADDVRTQEVPFTAAANEAFAATFALEYKRLRAAALESGEQTAVLAVEVRCNFSPDTRSVEVVTRPAPVVPRPFRRTARVGKKG